jgi:hypothetical protein
MPVGVVPVGEPAPPVSPAVSPGSGDARRGDRCDRRSVDGPADGEAGRPRTGRARALQESVRRLPQHVEHRRATQPSVDAAFEVLGRDAEVGGGIMAGALAYRLFIWLLPLALVVIAGLGYAADAESVQPKDAARSLGLAGIASSSVSSAAKSSCTRSSSACPCCGSRRAACCGR